MGRLRLNLACGDYDRTRALKDGVVQVDGVDLNFITLSGGLPELFWRMLRHEEFDAGELSMSGYIAERARGIHRFIAIPIFPSRSFRHSSFYIHSDSGIEKPEDLKGKTIGVPEYNMTAVMWARGILQHEYAVKPSDVVWLTGGLEQPGRTERIELDLPPGIVVQPIAEGQTLNAMFARGEIPALISPYPVAPFLQGHPKMRRLFPDYRRAEEDYYRKTRLFPIMHTVVVKESIYREAPWVAMNLYKAFCQAKDICFREIVYPGSLKVSIPWLIPEISREREILGEDLWPYGLAANRQVLETMIQFSYEQGLSPRKVPVEELFAKETLDQFKI
jgi:4,5-dihydroxyphthalate decarboxylase